MGKMTNILLAILILLLIIAIVGVFFMKIPAVSPMPDGDNTEININYDTSALDNGVVTTTENEIDICSSYTTNYPTYFTVREYQCGLAGGDWVCSENEAGCVDITSWDYSYGCSATDVQALKALCSALDGDWTCTATEISCSR